MIPDKLPTLFTKDFLEPPSVDFDNGGGLRSLTGWLMFFFLLNTEGEYLVLTEKDKQDYNKAVKIFKHINGISKHIELFNWEDEVSVSTQKKAFNKFSMFFNSHRLKFDES